MNDDQTIDLLREAVDRACEGIAVQAGLLPAIRRRRRRHRLRAGATLTAGAVVVAGGIGATVATAGRGSSHPAKVAVAASSTAAAAPTIELSPDLVDADFFISGAQSHLPSQITSLEAAYSNPRQATCLAQHGQQQTVDNVRGESHFYDFPDLAYIAAHGFAVSGSYVSGFDPDTATAQQGAAYQAAVTACNPYEDGIFASFDASSTNLAVDWQAELHEINAEPAAVAAAQGLGACFAGYGIHAATEADFFSVIEETPTSNDDHAYAACMAPVETVRTRLREAARPIFFRAHEAQLQALESQELSLKRQLSATDASPPQPYPLS